MDNGFLKIDLDKIQTIEEVKAMLYVLCRLHGWDGESDIKIYNDIVNIKPILTNLVKD